MSDDLAELTIDELTQRGRALRSVLAQRVRTAPRHTSVRVARGAPVAGTGDAAQGTRPWVRELIADCVKAGASVAMTASGHWQVEYDGRSVNIGSTCAVRTTKNDRARIRRKLGIQV